MFSKPNGIFKTFKKPEVKCTFNQTGHLITAKNVSQKSNSKSVVFNIPGGAESQGNISETRGTLAH